MDYVNGQYLVKTGWLEEHLGDPDLRVLDATVFLTRPEGGDQGRGGWQTESGLAAWEKGHIPGSAFADLIHDLSDQDAGLPFMAPTAEQFSRVMSRLGVSGESRVVCYDGAGSMWAARLWWLLRAFGFENAAVLNGGWRKWKLEGRPVSVELWPVEPGDFTARPRPELIASKEDVLRYVEGGGACVLNALAEEAHRGTGPQAYGRPGRIAGSSNVPAMHLLDRETHAYLPAKELRALFAAAGALDGGRVVTYCGGGIAASSDALALTLIGVEDVAVYDGSLSEWAADPSLPMEVG